MATTVQAFKATTKPSKQLLADIDSFAQRCAASALAPAKALNWAGLITKFIGFISQRCNPTEPAVAGDLLTTNARLLRKAAKDKCPNDIRKHVMVPSGIKSKGAQDDAFVVMMAQAAAEKDKTSNLIAGFCKAVVAGEIVVSDE